MCTCTVYVYVYVVVVVVIFYYSDMGEDCYIVTHCKKGDSTTPPAIVGL